MPFQPLDTIIDFLHPVNMDEILQDQQYNETQIGNNILVYKNHFPDIENVDMIIVGCSETRGAGELNDNSDALNAIRKQFYNLYNWHTEIKVADAGNIKKGATLQDTYAALKTVISELMQHAKKVVIIGGSHDITIAQYNVYASAAKIIEAACVDAKIDLDRNNMLPANNFLMSMFTSQPNFLKHYNHIGFQSYFVHSAMLEVIDKFGFDCFRVGKLKENIEEMEPVIRNANLFSFDIAAIQNSYAPANYLSPNGLTGEEACTLMQYAGMSANISSIGIYGYLFKQDLHNITANQISQMLWYLIDGIFKSRQEANFDDKKNFNEYHLSFAEIETVFLQSKKTGRWWMQMQDSKFIACSYNDYIIASNNQIPERWMRAVERS
ncbi:MAG: formimidoylglutamase [Chitinophagaceae bacterium]